MDFSDSGWGPVVGSYEYSNEVFDSVKHTQIFWEFFSLSTSQRGRSITASELVLLKIIKEAKYDFKQTFFLEEFYLLR
jgi:hypothetical protein